MKREELVSRVAAGLAVSQERAATVLDTVCEHLLGGLLHGEHVELGRYGVLRRPHRRSAEDSAACSAASCATTLHKVVAVLELSTKADADLAPLLDGSVFFFDIYGGGDDKTE